MDAFTIKDLEYLSGIKAHTIRVWEQRYSFLNPQRTQTNIRYYNNQELKMLLNVSLLHKYGFKISHIDKMAQEEMRQKVLSLSQAQAQQERTVNDLLQYMIDMDLESFEDTLNYFFATKGVERSIAQIVFPFLEKLGVLWQTSHINAAQEHLVSNIIRQKLIVGIDSIATHLHAPSSVLLFLPEGEYHELGLLFTHYLLKAHGVPVLYLGANVPLKDVASLVRIKKPDWLYCHLTSVGHHFSIEQFIQLLSANFPAQKIVLSGIIAQRYKKRLPEPIQMKSSLTEVVEFITAL
ncbi:MAG TPA: MerR family transcriptional regulator [Phnomibacter sp.]|nr:MerR family transcriptional regulator [Phnomibacter sp.]